MESFLLTPVGSALLRLGSARRLLSARNVV
jgi:hypothetical protein